MSSRCRLLISASYQICLVALDVDVTNLGLDEMRAYPELMTSVMWTSVRVLMDMLLFLIVSLDGFCSIGIRC